MTTQASERQIAEAIADAGREVPEGQTAIEWLAGLLEEESLDDDRRAVIEYANRANP